MQIVKPRFVIWTRVNGKAILRRIERAGRKCYKSEDKATPDSARKMVARLIRDGHESVIEHECISVLIICDRGVTHEIVRHRIGSYSQESTRYCNYRAKGVRYIRPFFFAGNKKRYKIWLKAMRACEEAYIALIEDGATPQEARSVLPNSLKTEIVVTYNLREWRHFFKLRTSRKAHPQMREITIPLLRRFQKMIPVVFDDITPGE